MADGNRHGCCPNHHSLLVHLYGSRLRTLREQLEELMHPDIEAGMDENDRGREFRGAGSGSGSEGLRLIGRSYDTEFCDADVAVENEDSVGLIRAGDSVEYVTLLEESYAVVAESAGRVGGRSMSQRWSQRQVRSTASRADKLSAPQVLDCNHLNVAAAFVSTQLWETLLSRVGEEAMLYLLSNAAIFVPLPNHALLQVAGHAVSMAGVDRKQIYQPIMSSSMRQQIHQSRLQQHASMVELENKSTFKITEAKTVNTNMEFGSSGLTVRGKEFLHVPEREVLSTKRARLSSWLRRKEQLKRKVVNDASSSSMTCVCTNPADVAAAVLHRKQRPHQLCTSGVVTATETACVCQGCCNSQAKDHHVRETSTILKKNGDQELAVSNLMHRVCPSNRAIDRSPMFYNSSFSCHAGLPKKHILNTIKISDDGICQLLGVMFEGLGRLDTKFKGTLASVADDVKERAVVKELKELLTKLVRNARLCNFARLLGRHCPLPSHLMPSLLATEYSRARSQFQVKEQAMSGRRVKRQEEGYVTQEVDAELPSSASTVQYTAGLTNGRMTSRLSLQPFMKEMCSRQVTEGTQTRVANISVEPANSSGRGKVLVKKRATGNLYYIKTYGSDADSKDPQVNWTTFGEKEIRKNEGSTPVLTELVNCYTNHSQVVAFLWAVCRSVLPIEFLGTTRFQRRLCSSIASFVSLRRHEDFFIQHILNKLQTSDITWLHGCTSQQNHRRCSREQGTFEDQITKDKEVSPPNLWALQQLMLQDWLHWLFTGLIVPLIHTHFYVTETENHRQNILYYRKPVWAKIQLLSLREMVSKCYTKLNTCTAVTLLQKRALGFSQIRMLPKHNGVRPIGNLSSGSKCALPYRKAQNCCSNISGFCLQPGPSVVHNLGNHSLAIQQAHVSSIGIKQVRFAFKSINSVLKTAHVCLKYEKEHHPEDLGASVFGYKDTYIKLLPFIMNLKGSSGGLPPVYMAVCDISRAYDTINQDKLCKVLSAFLQLPVYFVLRYATLLHTMGSLRGSYGRVCTKSDGVQERLETFMALTARRSHSILQDQGLVVKLKQEQLFALVEEHVKRNIVKIGSQFYLQKTGIAQGSVLSPLLCSLFFGHLDKQYLMPLINQTITFASPCNKEQNWSKQEVVDGKLLTSFRNFCLLKRIPCVNNIIVESKQDVNPAMGDLEAEPLKGLQYLKSAPKSISGSTESILLRQIDDSLLISTSQETVSQFVQTMHNGFEDYGCHVNRQKTAVSFNLHLDESQENFARNVYMTDDGACFMAWSGLLINCCTLEIQADYTRYIKEPIRGTLTVVRKKNPGSRVPIKLCHFVRAKCHPLLYDQRINSPSTVRLNAYQAFLLCAMKLHAYLCSMPYTSGHHPPFLLKAIEATSSYMYGLLRKQMQELGAGFHLGMEREEVKWLALYAFRKVLRRKQSRYIKLLTLLQERLEVPKYGHFSRCPHLASAIDEARSTMFKLIRY